MKLSDDVKQRKQKHFKQYRTAKQKLTNKENLVRFLHRGKPHLPSNSAENRGETGIFAEDDVEIKDTEQQN